MILAECLVGDPLALDVKATSNPRLVQDLYKLWGSRGVCDKLQGIDHYYLFFVGA